MEKILKSEVSFGSFLGHDNNIKELLLILVQAAEGKQSDHSQAVTDEMMD